MKFDLLRPLKIVLLGAGGTGGYIAPNLYRLVYSLPRKTEIIIVDGDIVEQKNLVRQHFSPADLGRNKAQALAERYAAAFGMETQYIPHYIEDEKELEALVALPVYKKDRGFWGENIGGYTILIGAVDNDRTRKMCNNVFELADRLIYIDSGNDQYTGQVVCGVRSHGRTICRPLAKIYPNVLEAMDKFPTELSCEEAAISAPQSMAANITAAAIVTNFVYNIAARGELITRYATFSTTTLTTRAVVSKSKRRAA